MGSNNSTLPELSPNLEIQEHRAQTDYDIELPEYQVVENETSEKQEQEKETTNVELKLTKKDVSKLQRSLVAVEKETILTFLKFAWEKYCEIAFPETSFEPDDLKKRGLFIPIFFSYQIAFVLLFINLFYFGYKAEMAKVYLSPLQYPIPDNCNQIPLTITNSWAVDKQGNWEGRPSYLPANAIYKMEMLDAEVTPEEFETAINYFEEKVKAASELASTRDDEFFFMTYATAFFKYKTRDGKGTITFSSVGDVSQMYQTIKVGNLAFFSRFGYCSKPESISAAFDPTQSSFVFNLQNDVGVYNPHIIGVEPITYLNSELCPQIFQEYSDLVDYRQKVLANQKVNIDIRSFMTAIAVNEGMKSLENLDRVFSTGSLAFYTDRLYKGMDPIYCSSGEGFKDVCLLLIGSNFYYPYYVNGGQSTKDCSNFFLKSCQSSNCPNRRGTSFFGLIFLSNLYTTPTANPTNPLYQEIAKMPSQTRNENFFRASSLAYLMEVLLTIIPESELPLLYFYPNIYNCSLADASLNMTAEKHGLWDPWQWVVGEGHEGTIVDAALLVMKQICGEYNCTILHMEATVGPTVTDYFQSKKINSDYAYINYSIAEGCTEEAGCGPYLKLDKLYHPEVFSKIRTNPPVILIQAVVNCTTTRSDAVVTSGGIAISNTTAAISIFLTLFVIISTYIWNKRGNQKEVLLPVDKKEEKRKEVIVTVLHSLLDQLPDSNEGKHRLIELLYETFQDIGEKSEKFSEKLEN